MNSGFLKLQRNLLSMPGIADMYSVEGATGLGLYVSINLYLSHCEGGWGVYTGTQMTVLAVEGHRRRTEVKRVINDYGLFVVDDKEKRFTSHWMQQQFNKGARKLRQSCGTPARTYNPRAEEIELEIEKENKEKGGKVPDVIGPSAYELIDRAGLRHGHRGETVPWWAPPQTDIRSVWSIVGNCWMPINDIDVKAEQQQRKQMANEDFMMKTAWETLSEDEQQRIQDYGKRI